MGLRFRKSVSLGKGLRLNFGKKGVSVSAGVRGAHVTYSTTGRKTTSVGIPGTGISYVKSEKIGGKKTVSGEVPPSAGDNNNLLGSTPPPKRKRGCITGGIIALAVIIMISAISQCSGGSGSSSSQISSASSSSIVSSEVASSEILSSEAPSSETLSSATTSSAVSSTSKAASSSTAIPAVTTNSKIAITDAPGTVSNGSNATLSIKGKPNTEYSISVYYSGGASKAQGLEAKTSGADGTVSWTWKVGAKTTAGTHRIVVEGGGDKLETSITTTK